MGQSYKQGFLTGILAGSAWGCVVNDNWIGAAAFLLLAVLFLFFDHRLGWMRQ